MLRRIFLISVIAAVIGFAIYWWLTIPAVIASNRLPAYTPNTANGLTTFNAGGCSSCHAVPGQPDRPMSLKLGEFFWQNAGVTRAVRNSGTTRVELVEFELK